MSPKFEEFLNGHSKEIDPVISEISIFKQLIKERKEPLDLIRELLSNSGAREVDASRIEISYTKDKEGHIFEVLDDGCGMDYTENVRFPGRLDRFLGLGLSGIIGQKADEFSWKGLGSKLAYQSRKVEIETCQGGVEPLYEVRINEPWETLSNNNIPKPRITKHSSGENKGTRIRVIGHPPHRIEEPFTFDGIKKYLLHRTFAGYTAQRETKPKILLSVLGKTEEFSFGFPEFANIEFDKFAHESLYLDVGKKTLFINMTPKSSKELLVTVKGFITWDAEQYDLSTSNLNTGLILSVKGIPYFKLNMEDYGVTTIRTARPGENKSCLVVECDWIHDEMNISRSGIVDSPKALELKRIVGEIFQRIETSEEFLKFRRIPERDKVEVQSGILAEQKRKIESHEQNWIVYESDDSKKPDKILIREPENEQDVNALIWKLEALNALPFETFNTLGYIGAGKGPDLLVNFLEDKGGEPQRGTVVEVELNFYNYKIHGHKPSQYPKVICWDIPQSGRKVKLNRTSKSFKYTVNLEEYQVHIYCIKLMPNIKVYSLEELREKGISF